MELQIEQDYKLNKIIEGCKKGDLKAQKALYETYAKQMTILCIRYVGNQECAIDIMHDSFIHLFSVIQNYEAKGSFEGWIKRIFTNQSLMYLRKFDLLRNSDDIDVIQNSFTSNDVSVLDQLSADEIMKEITNLKPLYRSIFNLHALDGYSHKEIANQLNMNEATIRSIYSRARQILQKKLIQNETK